jgi:hypothetical protein
MYKNKNSWLKIILTIVGAMGGFLYWKLIGCTTGTRLRQSDWYFSSLWGMALGYLLGDLIGNSIGKEAVKDA